ncbi:MAG TPA: hypothetical protein VG937_38465 [Polyangiaceae bacterium]|nr:hypothetical protein [Polyangiaceae bacterium]
MPLQTRPLSLLGHLALLGLAVGCTNQPRAHNVTGPDGSPMLHVACGADQGACFELAGRGCPGGYKVFPVFDPRDNNFLIRCQGAAPEMVALPASGGSPFGTGVYTPPQAPVNAWPENVSIAAKPPPTTGTRNDSEIDLGY